MLNLSEGHPELRRLGIESMYKLRQYQQDAVNNTIRYFQQRREPAVIVLPTGAGKSLVIAELAKIAKGRVLVLAHVKELVDQNHQKYESYGLSAGIYSAGLNKKEADQKVIFGSIQSVAKAGSGFFQDVPTRASAITSNRFSRQPGIKGCSMRCNHL